MGTAGWVGVKLDAKTDWKLLAGLLTEAYAAAAEGQSAAKIAKGPANAKKTAKPRPRKRRKAATPRRPS